MASSANRRTLLALLALAAGMFMLAYAAEPLYRMFCQVTGFGGTTQRAVALPDKVLDRAMTVRFNADTDPALPWKFYPLQKEVTVKLGERGLAFFEAVNEQKTPVTGMAVYNVTPDKAGAFFNKIQCFCFDRQTLQPGQKMVFPVTFFVDPALADEPMLADLRTITLSYTFFPAK